MTPPNNNQVMKIFDIDNGHILHHGIIDSNYSDITMNDFELDTDMDLNLDMDLDDNNQDNNVDNDNDTLSHNKGITTFNPGERIYISSFLYLPDSFKYKYNVYNTYLNIADIIPIHTFHTNVFIEELIQTPSYKEIELNLNIPNEFQFHKLTSSNISLKYKPNMILDTAVHPTKYIFNNNDKDIILNKNDINTSSSLKYLITYGNSLFNTPETYYQQIKNSSWFNQHTQQHMLTSYQHVLQSLFMYGFNEMNISYSLYTNIIYDIQKSIQEFKSNMKRNQIEYAKLSSLNSFVEYISYDVIENLKKNKHHDVFKLYNIDEQKLSYTLYLQCLRLDNGYFLFDAISKLDTELYSDTNLRNVLENKLQSLSSSLSSSSLNDSCSVFPESESKSKSNRQNNAKHILSKKYTSLYDLQQDNDKAIYFDSIYDETRYDYIDIFHKEYNEMKPEDFKLFLIQNIKRSNSGLTTEEIENEVDAILEQKRIIRDGYYAILELNSPSNDKKNITYYIRKSNKWVLDEHISENKIENICVMKPMCVFDEKQKDSNPDHDIVGCKSIETIRKELEQKLTKTLVDEIIEHDVSTSNNIKNIIESSFLQSKTRLFKLLQRENATSPFSLNPYMKFYHPDLLSVKYDSTTTINHTHSPHSRLFERILGVSTFSKRMELIHMFIHMYTRNHLDNEEEEWLYCIDTNTKLVPSFYKSLSYTFLFNPLQYQNILNRICAERGFMSSDGDKWIDKFSNRVITNIDFVNEFDDMPTFTIPLDGLNINEDGHVVDANGHLSSSSSQLTSDSLVNTTSSTSSNNFALNDKKNKDLFKKIKILVHGLEEHTGIKSSKMTGFITRHTYTFYNLYASMRDDTFKNRFVILAVSILYLFSIQTLIPHPTSHKPYPGCKFSLSGYPLSGDADLTSLEYIACILKTSTKEFSKDKSSIWNSIKKLKKKDLVVEMKKMFTLMKRKNDDEFTVYINTKINHMKKTQITQDSDKPVSELLNGHFNSSQPWNYFYPISLSKSLTHTTEYDVNIPDDMFYNQLKTFYNSGKKEQQHYLDILKAKLTKLTIFFQYKINKHIQKEELHLRSLNTLYQENSCCLTHPYENTVNYFTKKFNSILSHQVYSSEIQKYIEVSKTLKSNIILRSNHDKRKWILYNQKQQLDTNQDTAFLNLRETTIYQIYLSICQHMQQRKHDIHINHDDTNDNDNDNANDNDDNQNMDKEKFNNTIQYRNILNICAIGLNVLKKLESNDDFKVSLFNRDDTDTDTDKITHVNKNDILEPNPDMDDIVNLLFNIDKNEELDDDGDGNGNGDDSVKNRKHKQKQMIELLKQSGNSIDIPFIQNLVQSIHQYNRKHISFTNTNTSDNDISLSKDTNTGHQILLHILLNIYTIQKRLLNKDNHISNEDTNNIILDTDTNKDKNNNNILFIPNTNIDDILRQHQNSETYKLGLGLGTGTELISEGDNGTRVEQYVFKHNLSFDVIKHWITVAKGGQYKNKSKSIKNNDENMKYGIELQMKRNTDFFNVLFLDIQDKKDKVIEFIQSYYSIQNNTFKKQDILHFIETIDEFSFTSIEHENTNVKTIRFLKECLWLFTCVYPNSILYRNNKQFEIPEHWGLSTTHQNDILGFLNDENNPLRSFHGIEHLTSIFREYSSIFHNIYSLSEYVVEIDDKTNPLHFIDNRNRILIHKWLFFTSMNCFVNIEQHILQQSEETYELEKTLSKYISSCLGIFMKHKKIININENELKKRLLRHKDDEKNTKIKRLEDMDDDERDADNKMKKFKIGNEYNHIFQKGLTRYDPEFYDREHEDAIKQAEFDFIHGDKEITDTTKARLDVMKMDNIHDTITDFLIEQEETDMSHIIDDDDHGGDNDALDDNFDGYDF